METDKVEAQDREQLAALRADVLNLIKTVAELTTKEALDSVKTRVKLLESVVLGGVGVVLIAVISAGLALVLRK